MTAKANKSVSKKGEVTRFWVSYLGYDEDIDAEVVRWVGMQSIASSFSLLTAMRELEFEGAALKVEEAMHTLASVQASNNQLPNFTVITEE